MLLRRTEVAPNHCYLTRGGGSICDASVPRRRTSATRVSSQPAIARRACHRPACSPARSGLSIHGLEWEVVARSTSANLEQPRLVLRGRVFPNAVGLFALDTYKYAFSVSRLQQCTAYAAVQSRAAQAEDHKIKRKQCDC